MSTKPTSTEEHNAQERRTAVRALLMRPVITAGRHREDLHLVRKHAAQLKRTFTAMLGYQLVVEPSFARLLKSPLSADTAPRPALAHNGRPFTARTYACLALVCASLLSPQTGEQVLMSSLIEQVRADAVTAGVDLDDAIGGRRDLVRAITLLVEWGVLTETDGSVTAWDTQKEDALLDVHRPLLPHLLSRALLDVPSADALLNGEHADSAEPEQPRRELRRRLVENPLVRREDLSDAERDVLTRERRELARVLEEQFGLTLEARAEGVLAYDVEETVSDVPFPSTGTVARSALLLIHALADDLRGKAGDTAMVGGREVPGVHVPTSVVEANVELLIEQYGSAFASQYSDNAALLAAEAVKLLESVCLVVAVDDGIVLHPASARYRPEPQRAPARTRASRRLHGAEDYLAAAEHSRLPLAGVVPNTLWAPDLAPAMRARGVAVHEESVLDDLLRDVADIS
ncbi:TIGR02678 family protein [Actinokineospora sp. G85]|uniref:TIGR02678 family protein n=1 Tax=Actinokineospora sp. G85 TaxID=3406626 RepID=UPI003C744774